MKQRHNSAPPVVAAEGCPGLAYGHACHLPCGSLSLLPSAQSACQPVAVSGSESLHLRLSAALPLVAELQGCSAGLVASAWPSASGNASGLTALLPPPAPLWADSPSLSWPLSPAVPASAEPPWGQVGPGQPGRDSPLAVAAQGLEGHALVGSPVRNLFC